MGMENKPDVTPSDPSLLVDHYCYELFGYTTHQIDTYQQIAILSPRH